MYMLWFNFIPGLIFIFFCFKLIIIYYHTQKQKKIKIKPRIKMNHNIYTVKNSLIMWSKWWHMCENTTERGGGGWGDNNRRIG